VRALRLNAKVNDNSMNELHLKLLAHVTAAPRCRRLAITYYFAVIVIVGNVAMPMSTNGFVTVTGWQSRDASRHIRANV